MVYIRLVYSFLLYTYSFLLLAFANLLAVCDGKIYTLFFPVLYMHILTEG